MKRWLVTIALVLVLASRTQADEACAVFSPSNPSGSWTYGWTGGAGGSTFYADATYANQDEWGDAVWYAGPNRCQIRSNGTTQVHHPNGTSTLSPGECAVLPGTGGRFFPDGEWAVIRWTAPSAGIVVVEADFTGASGYGGSDSSRVSLDIVRGTYAPLDAGLNTWCHPGNRVSSSGSWEVAAGDVIDFRVGYGGCVPAPHYTYDLVTVRAAVTLEQPLATRSVSWGRVRVLYR